MPGGGWRDLVPLAYLPTGRKRVAALVQRLNRQLQALEAAGGTSQAGYADLERLRTMRDALAELLGDLDQQLAPTDLARRRN